LKQGDPLALLLFLVVAEGLGALMRNAVDRGRFKPFHVGRGGMPISMLQYADDTLCIGEATVDNLWTLKAILRGFEMVSGLKVNFWKSCLMGVNISNDFLLMASDFLNCRIGGIPFSYLGLPVGANPHLASTWQPLVDVLKKRLGSWGNKYVSLGGRIVLINAVLSSIPIFYLSYMKMPVKVWKEIVKLQRHFLWGGLSSKRKICWVKWVDICKPKSEGGLGIRDLRLVNLSLLAKWRWKLLMNGDEVWKRIIVSKYGENVVGSTRLEVNGGGGHTCFAWWKDLCRLDEGVGWFNHVVRKKLGRGNTINFWKDIWVGDISLEQRFPILFNISVQHGTMIRDMGRWENGVWRWELLWRRRFFAWEEPMLCDLEVVINGVVMEDVEDSWEWVLNVEEGFKVKSLFIHLQSTLLPQNLVSQSAKFACKNVWRSAVPSKVSAFAWQLLLDRVSTKDNLVKRGLMHWGEDMCSLCGLNVETTRHLFLHCRFAAAV
jgi:hypothetical protein